MLRRILMVYLILAPGLLLPAIASHAAVQAQEPSAESDFPVTEPAQDPVVTELNKVNGDFGGLVGIWTLVAIDGVMPPMQRGAPTLEVMADGSVAGFGGVNRYRALLKTDQLPERVGFTLGPLTMMAGPKEIMVVEQNYLERLGTVSTFRIESDILHLYAGASEALTFKRSTEQ